MEAPVAQDIEQSCAHIEHRLSSLLSDKDAIEADSRNNWARFYSLLTETCGLAERISTVENGERVNAMLNGLLQAAYGELGMDEGLPHPFGYKDGSGLQMGPHQGPGFFPFCMKQVISSFQQFFARDRSIPNFSSRVHFPSPWSATPRPHALSSPIARFESAPAHAASTCLAALYQARCEVRQLDITTPVSLLYCDGVIAMPSMGGWKNRTPMLDYSVLGATPTGRHPIDWHSVDVGLVGIAYHGALDPERKLIFLGDGDRIKSYAWGDAASSEPHKDALPTHTLDSECGGPIAALPRGRVLHAGRGRVQVWNLDDMPTHGAEGIERIGRKIRDFSDSWWDGDDEIEDSWGSAPSLQIGLSDESFKPGVWTPHPALLGVMLCGSTMEHTLSEADFSAVAIDLEHGGVPVARYFGCSAEITGISTSPGDPNTCLVSVEDGFTRLYDLRSPLPVLTLAAGYDSQTTCRTGLFVHADGVPFVFTGAEQDEVIRLWDVRASQLVCELATGNNAVGGLAWDNARNRLFAATACEYIDRMGGSIDYRRAKLPKDPAETMDEDEDADEYGYDSEDDEDRCWPLKAVHGEDYFGHCFDAGDHCLYCYSFKDEPDLTVLPEYGRATLESEAYSW